MSLRACADSAEDVATGFMMFRPPLPEHATEITGLMADLYSISVALKRLDDMSANRAYRYNLPQIQPDLDMVLNSLAYTLEDVIGYFNVLERGASSSQKLFKRTWSDLVSFFWDESQESLSTRLGKYRSLLNELQYEVMDKPFDSSHNIWANVKALLISQEGRESRLPVRPGPTIKRRPPNSSSSLDPDSPVSERRPRNRRSYERHRPSSSVQSPESPLSPASGTFSSGLPLETPESSRAASSASQSTPIDSISEHWATTIFRDEHPLTPIPNSGHQISRCFGEPIPEFKSWLRDEGYEELFQMAFNDDYNLRVFMYCREKDRRIRIVCKTPQQNSKKHSEYHSLPLNLLEVYRIGPCLQFRRRRRGEEPFAELKFKTIERMVIFYCTFLALRSQDRAKQVEEIRDYELDGELELYAGKIYDDQYINGLRIFQDEVTGVLRLQASVYQGEMKRAPVWTAFITDEIRSRSWIRMSNADPEAVILRNLRRHIFADSDYTPLKTRGGEDVLKFTTRRDAKNFVTMIGSIADQLYGVVP